MAAKRSQKGAASFGSPSKRFRSSSDTSEPHKTPSLLTLWNIPSPTVNDKPSAAAQTSASTSDDAGFQKTSHSSIASGFLHAQGGEKATQKRREQARQKPIQNGHVNSEDLAVVRAFDLPTEVLEMILCQVNIRDLYFSCRLVCKRWNDVVMREKFIQWKKTYYCHKITGDCLHSIGGGWCGHTCVLDMTKFVCNTFEHFTADVWIRARLQKHPRYNCITRIIECHPNAKQWCDHSIPAMVTLLVISSLLEVLELFYCLATLCFALWHDLNILPPRIHYLLFYCVNRLERGSRTIDCSQLLTQQSSSAGGLEQQSLFKYCSGGSSLKLTSEQLRIVNHRLQPGDIVKVVAFAGTGKTTTLQNFARLNPHIKFLYCVFNK
ncbi:hypothetical protein EMCRGX_G002426 [Ephydatia muelleri]